jgi:ABC-type Fe3+/spermidine/putrescine transport system ATPase subunit
LYLAHRHGVCACNAVPPPRVADQGTLPLSFALRIDGLTRRIRRGPLGLGRGRAVLEGVSLEVAPGCLLAVVGAAGAGKSTLLRLLAGAERPTEGGFSHPGIEAHQLGTALQGDALSTRHSIAENVAAPLGRLRRGIDRASAKRLTANALDLLALTPFANTLPQNADAAIRQRALLARALVAEPRLLLLDEPFHQEETDRASLAVTLRQLHELLGTTTILATRSAATALPLADAMAVLHEGRLVEAGSPQSLYEQPASVRTAALLGPVNTLPGTIYSVEDDIASVHLACGPVVEARLAQPLAAGAGCVLCIRPERIAIAAAAAADMGGDALDAAVIAARFAGATTRLRALIGSGAELIIDRPTAAGLRGLAPGEPAAVAWQAHHATAYPA